MGTGARPAGSFRPKSEHSQAVDVVDALLAELICMLKFYFGFFLPKVQKKRKNF